MENLRIDWYLTDDQERSFSRKASDDLECASHVPDKGVIQDASDGKYYYKINICNTLLSGMTSWLWLLVGSMTLWCFRTWENNGGSKQLAEAEFISEFCGLQVPQGQGHSNWLSAGSFCWRQWSALSVHAKDLCWWG